MNRHDVNFHDFWLLILMIGVSFFFATVAWIYLTPSPPHIDDETPTCVDTGMCTIPPATAVAR